MVLRAVTRGFRRDEMEPIARARLFKQLVAAFRQQVQFSDEVIGAMSDEQYIRNCVDTIYRMAKYIE